MKSIGVVILSTLAACGRAEEHVRAHVEQAVEHHVAVTAAEPAIDPEMAAVCEAGCAAEEGYSPTDVVAQPGAAVGDLTRCPVSGVVFEVKAGQPSYEHGGRTWYTCCGGCMKKLAANPDRFIRS